MPYTTDPPTRCLFCGEGESLDVLEYDPAERWFTIETCCELSHEMWVLEMQEWSTKTWNLFFHATVGEDFKKPFKSDGLFVLNYGLTVEPIEFKTATQFVNQHHRHLDASRGWRFGFGCYNGHLLLGVCMVGRPVARMIDGTKVCEVNRVAVREDIENYLTYNVCSKLYGAGVREVKNRGFEKVITYTITDEENGASLRASGFEVEEKLRARKGRNGERLPARTRWKRELVKGAC